MKNVLIFATGAAIGSVVTWKLIEKKYKDLADEEIASVVETFKNRDKKKPGRPKKVKEPTVDTAMEGTKKLGEVIKEEGYNSLGNVSDDDCTVEVDVPEDHIPPYLISPDQFGDNDDYGTKTLTYYADGVLADEVDNPIMDVDGTIGADTLNHFGEYVPDAVYVRDETNEMDYEILKTEDEFSEVTGRSGY